MKKLLCRGLFFLVLLSTSVILHGMLPCAQQGCCTYDTKDNPHTCCAWTGPIERTTTCCIVCPTSDNTRIGTYFCCGPKYNIEICSETPAGTYFYPPQIWNRHMESMRGECCFCRVHLCAECLERCVGYNATSTQDFKKNQNIYLLLTKHVVDMTSFDEHVSFLQTQKEGCLPVCCADCTRVCCRLLPEGVNALKSQDCACAFVACREPYAVELEDECCMPLCCFCPLASEYFNESHAVPRR